MARVLIIADDLTGALDSAVGFAGAGRKVVVARHPGSVPEALAMQPDVLAVNTASREIAPDAAVAQVTAALSHLQSSAFDVVMKKVDSRLKGNLSAETRAVMRWRGGLRCVVSPAIPSMGRRVEAGMLLGDGVATPVPVAGRFEGSVEVPDVVDEDDFDAIVGRDLGSTLWVGARGLAFALARRLGVRAPETARLDAPVMVANGSRDPVTLAQIAALPSEIQVVTAPDGRADLTNFTNDRLVLTISEGGGGVSGQEAARRFAESVEVFAHAYRPAGLLICGGESAHAILDRLDINSLQVVAELRPGLPLCEVETGWGRVRIVTKSGGFGPPDLMVSVLEETGAVV
ncbi:four-carbon acid sugar kinase family protein [uncultured Martelella sp.]|uniref:four-carbon acid sugar kinase family protein n=1 Tax=uncultured Martelella sp. TaxID=392331 RepID=UPI0029C961D6|nr:four-carbon acid sugar kinase family protein [uncultured Martelella sp.]